MFKARSTKFVTVEIKRAYATNLKHQLDIASRILVTPLSRPFTNYAAVYNISVLAALNSCSLFFNMPSTRY